MLRDALRIPRPRCTMRAWVHDGQPAGGVTDHMVEIGYALSSEEHTPGTW